MADSTTCDEECFFDCGKKDPPQKAGPERIRTIIKSSKQRNDDLHISLSEQLDANAELQIPCHRTCVSTYTSKTHINRHNKRTSTSSLQSEPPTTKRRRSDIDPFDFKKHCLFCGTICCKPNIKNPSRWRKVSQVITADRCGQKTFKDLILEVCDKRQDIWSDEVRVRVHGATTDLHAADAQYHQDCRKQFMHSAHVDNLTKQNDDNDDKDNAFERVISAMNNEVTRLWNSVELIRLYQECEGSRLSRRGLISAVKEHFNERLLVLSSPGVASLIVFREQCALNIVDVQGDDDNIAAIAKSITSETVKPEKWVYETRLNHDNVNANVSSTLLNLLGELKCLDCHHLWLLVLSRVI